MSKESQNLNQPAQPSVERQVQVIDFSWSTIFKVISVCLLIYVGFKFITVLTPLLILIVAAIFFAVALNPAVSQIVHYLPSANRTFATGIAFLTIMVSVSTFFFITIPPIFSQILEFGGDLPKMFQDFQDTDFFLADLINKHQLDDEITTIFNQITNRLAGAESGLTGLLNIVASFLINIVVIIIMTFMFLIEGPKIIKQLSRLARTKEQLDQFNKIINKMYGVITAYVGGQLLIAVIGSTVALVVMTILQVPNSLAMSGIVALFSLIPLIGATISAVIVVLSILLASKIKLAIIMAIFFVIYQQIENATIQPYIQGRNLDLSILFIFIIALVGAQIAGLWGALLIVPLCGCLRVLLVEYLKNSRFKNQYLG